jgi:hypothetical protein
MRNQMEGELNSVLFVAVRNNIKFKKFNFILMKKNFFSLLLFFGIFAGCQDDLQVNKSNEAQNLKHALLKIDSYYRSEQAQLSTQEDLEKTVLFISKAHGVTIVPISRIQYLTYFYKRPKSNVLEAPGCGGKINSSEVVDEGNGCLGIVRQFQGGAVSLTRYCSNGGSVSLDSYECFLPGSTTPS